MFAVHPDEFDANWLAGCLNQPPNSLKGWQSMPVGSGQVGDSYRLKLDWNMALIEGDAPMQTVIAKCPAADESSRKAGKDFHTYELEVRWYAEFAQHVKIRCPDCHHASIAPDLTHFWLLMEDAAPAEQGDQIAGASRQQVAATLQESALLHASYWNNEVLREKPWLHYRAQNGEMANGLFGEFYKEWKVRFADLVSADVLSLGQELVDRYPQVVAYESKDSNFSLIHGDLRLDNVLYATPQDRPIVVDWQTVALDHPMSDVAYCVGTSFENPQERASCEESLIQEYLQTLKNEGVNYSMDAAWNEYRANAFGGFVMAVFAAMVVERTQRGDAMFASMAQRSGDMAMHLGTLSLVCA